ncbi:hypothetical protein AW736_10940 [Termitidicoccus mucosus]|uniref:Uncharacterized protein n=1 Tax=Termitidicoccus mucosus TaxID=1184151 RepID=A0A178IJG8_9BACT|nr:hypothetical protein AW736_10940 [Opitutaceae bacterium TSB47]
MFPDHHINISYITIYMFDFLLGKLIENRKILQKNAILTWFQINGSVRNLCNDRETLILDNLGAVFIMVKYDRHGILAGR